MIRIAQDRIAELIGLAEGESRRGTALPDRYVRLARKVGMRYNVRLLPEYRELYCRRCSTFWVEGRTVRTRLRRGNRVRTCLNCQRSRRVPIHARGAPKVEGDPTSFRFAPDAEVGLAETGPDDENESDEDETEDV